MFLTREKLVCRRALEENHLVQDGNTVAKLLNEGSTDATSMGVFCSKGAFSKHLL